MRKAQFSIFPEDIYKRLREMAISRPVKKDPPKVNLRWVKPQYKIAYRFCDNPWCRAKLTRPSKEGVRFCSETCWRKLLTRDELQLAIKLELDDNKSELDNLRDRVSKRYIEKIELFKRRFYGK
jgi:hypothetical protein